MPGLCGCIGEPSALLCSPEILNTMMSNLPDASGRKDEGSILRSDRAAGGQTQGADYQVATPAGQIFLIVGRPIWTDRDIQDVSVERGAARALAHAYDRYGLDLFEFLHGAFALAILDPNQRTALLAIDRFGFETLRYRQPAQATLHFASHADALCRVATSMTRGNSEVAGTGTAAKVTESGTGANRSSAPTMTPRVPSLPSRSWVGSSDSR